MKQQKLFLNTLLAALALGVSATASAHLPYVLPFQFHTDQDVATLYAGSAERYFEPEIPGGGVEGGYDFTVTNPAGESRHIEYISRHRQLTLIEIDTKEVGTYKVERTLVSRAFPSVAYKGKSVDVVKKASLGEEERKSREAEKIKDGERQFFFDDEVKPGEIVPVQYVNHITAYVTRGKPNEAALKTSGKGFEFDFRTHPNAVSVQSGLQFVALVDGGDRFRDFPARFRWFFQESQQRPRRAGRGGLRAGGRVCIARRSAAGIGEGRESRRSALYQLAGRGSEAVIAFEGNHFRRGC